MPMLQRKAKKKCNSCQPYLGRENSFLTQNLAIDLILSKDPSARSLKYEQEHKLTPAKLPPLDKSNALLVVSANKM